MRFVLTPWVSANLRTWVLPSPNRRMMSKQEYQSLRQVASHPFAFLSHSLVNLGFREALGGIGFDTGYRVAHTEIVKSPVGIIVFLAYLSHRIKVASGTLFVRERVAHGLLVVSRRNEPAVSGCTSLSSFPPFGKGLFRCSVYLRSSSFLSFYPAWRRLTRSACSRLSL